MIQTFRDGTLDSRDHNAAFVQLWGLLEKLTATQPEDPHAQAAERTLFIVREERAYHEQVLKHLRNYRNMTVHQRTTEKDEIEILLYQLKRYVEKLLLFHVFNIFEFASIPDATKLLEFKPDSTKLQSRIQQLRKQIEVSNKALQFLSQQDRKP